MIPVSVGVLMLAMDSIGTGLGSERMTDLVEPM